MPTEVNLNGRDLHGPKKWLVFAAVIAGLVAAYALFSAPAWLLALMV
jgi:hypothetical protein